MRAETTRSFPAAFLNIAGTVIIAAALAVGLLAGFPRLLGITGYTVLSGSMEPEIPTGSVVYARPVDTPEQLTAGDIIVFHQGLGETPVVHRILENHVSDGTLITKGDANAAEDLQPVPYADVIGREILHIPHLGRILSLSGTWTGRFSLIALIFGGLLLCHVAAKIRS